MKQVILIGLLIISFCLSSTAQNSWGLKLGWNNNHTRDYIVPDHARPLVLTRSSNGFHLGITHHRDWPGIFDLELELLYSLKGAKAMFMRARDQQFHYLSVPVMASIDLSDALRVKGGLEISYLLHSRTTGNIRIIDKDRKVDAGAILGLSMDFGNKWMLEARYIRGLFMLVNYAVSDQVSAPEAEYAWYNQVFQISVGYYLSK